MYNQVNVFEKEYLESNICQQFWNGKIYAPFDSVVSDVRLYHTEIKLNKNTYTRMFVAGLIIASIKQLETAYMPFIREMGD